jgi:hypothetical protein
MRPKPWHRPTPPNVRNNHCQRMRALRRVTAPRPTGGRRARATGRGPTNPLDAAPCTNRNHRSYRPANPTADRAGSTDIPRVPGQLGAIVRLGEARHNEIRSQPTRWQPNRRIARLAVLELVALRSSRRTSAVVVCHIRSQRPSCWGGRRPQLGDQHQDFLEHPPGDRSSSGGEFHPSALTKPDVRLSPHPASTFQPTVGYQSATDTRGSGLAARAVRANALRRFFDIATACISVSPIGREPR